ncbi:MAG: aminomethyl-transferring glycine dehydrogenase subunit GcvPB [Candidatus Bathyarchaeota archaeon]|nr:MAG: aminomethyl-transferring glycine dehydrogenase subunit GcvPB [Candidatus Bathyarchaeota archaeon]
MTSYRQAKWFEPVIFEMGAKQRRGYTFTQLDKEIKDSLGSQLKCIPNKLRRNYLPDLPELSEVEIVRHYTKLSQMAFGVDLGSYPLGSCTMKYNPKLNEAVASSDNVRWIHPYQDESTVQGALEIMYKLSRQLAEITGMYAVSLQPAAGSHGEFAGSLIIRACHRFRRNSNKDEMLVPDSAHGTNPASAAMAGFKVIVVPSGADGCINVDALKNAVSAKTAGLMLTNPNTLGIFEKNILEISDLIHEVDAILYYDGANLNGILGKAKPRDMGFDIVHINIHKTFSTPHGGGGPGAGPIGVTKELEPFLPIPRILCEEGAYRLDYNRPNSIGKLRSFYGSFDILVRAYSYILMMGAKGLETSTEIAVLNANYLATKISVIRGFELPYDANKLRKHEFVVSCSKLKKETGITAKQVAKRLMDYGIHPPTIYFPLIIDEALMIEPTETESLEELDRLVTIFAQISTESYENPKTVRDAPHNTSIRQLDEAKAAHPRMLRLSWKMHKNRSKHDS